MYHHDTPLLFLFGYKYSQKSDATVMSESFTTDISVGHIESGTVINSTDKVRDIVKSIIYKPEPSDEYDSENTLVATWNSSSDVDSFFTTYKYSNGWNGLKVGNTIQINDGTYNVAWIIAGFNCETAADGVVGGIVLIPSKVDLLNHNWHSDNTVATPYINSDIHSYINGTIKTNLSSVLGTHIVNRNVSLGSACDSSTGYTTATTDTTAYLTLMSTTQMGFTAASYNNAYDDGEANYVLRLFDSSYGSGNYMTTSTYYGSEKYSYPWFRNVWGLYYSISWFSAWGFYNNIVFHDTYTSLVNSNNGVRPLLYLR